MRKQDYPGIVVTLWMVLLSVVMVAILKFAL
jgi:hypothetical protein